MVTLAQFLSPNLPYPLNITYIVGNSNLVFTIVFLFSLPTHLTILIMKIFQDKAGLQKNYGDFRLHVESVENHTEIDQLCHHRETNNNLKITSFSWSEKKGFIISVTLIAPTSLVDKLVQKHLVNQVFNKKNDFTIVLNNTSAEKKSLALTQSEEQVLAQ